MSHAAPIIDIGGGASTLVDHLLAEGYGDITVLDIAAGALAAARMRLGAASKSVTWIEDDITGFVPPRRYQLWHDRAVLHFLTTPQDRARYHAALTQGIASGGYAIFATFGPQGPLKCSGLDVVRYAPEDLAAFLGAGFRLLRSDLNEHVTPAGKNQQFCYTLFQAAP